MIILNFRKAKNFKHKGERMQWFMAPFHSNMEIIEKITNLCKNLENKLRHICGIFFLSPPKKIFSIKKS